MKILMTDSFFPSSSKFKSFVQLCTDTLGAEGVSYCIIGGVALDFYDYTRATTDLDVLVSSSMPLSLLKLRLAAHGFKNVYGRRFKHPKFSEFEFEVIHGGERLNPKDIAYPEPEEVSEKKDGYWVISLKELIHVKLAGYVFNKQRMKDGSDVQELIKANMDTLKNSKFKFPEPLIQQAWTDILRNTLIWES